MVAYAPKDMHAVSRTRSGGAALFQRLVRWVAGRDPVVQFDPSPPVTDYGRLRPWDLRDISTMELLPVELDDGLLAIVFPYVPVGYETSLVITPPGGLKVKIARDIWGGEEMTAKLEKAGDTNVRLPLKVPGDCELLAIRLTDE